MAVRFRGDVNFILVIAAIGFFVLAMVEVGLVVWRLVDWLFGPF